MESGRFVFTVGEAFPVDDPVAVFIVAISTALSDLLRTNMRLVGGDDNEPFQQSITSSEQQYLLRVNAAQLHELRESITHGRKQPEVEGFIDGLSAAARKDLDVLLGGGVPQTPLGSERPSDTSVTRHPTTAGGGTGTM